MTTQRLSTALQQRLQGTLGRALVDDTEMMSFFRIVGIQQKKNIKIITEAILIGSIASHGIREDLVILSDEASQFDVFLHALCWMHAERKLSIIISINDYEHAIIEKLLNEKCEKLIFLLV